MTRDELIAICEAVEFQTWLLEVSHPLTPDLFVRVEFAAYDNHDEASDEEVTQHGRWWHISAGATESEVVRTIWAAILMAVEHETREQFKYKGRAIFDPHFCIGCLLHAEISEHGLS